MGMSKHVQSSDWFRFLWECLCNITGHWWGYVQLANLSKNTGDLTTDRKNTDIVSVTSSIALWRTIEKLSMVAPAVAIFVIPNFNCERATRDLFQKKIKPLSFIPMYAVQSKHWWRSWHVLGFGCTFGAWGRQTPTSSTFLTASDTTTKLYAIDGAVM